MTTTLTFEEIQQDVLAKAKAVEACSSEYRRAGSAKDIKELLTVIKDNMAWCLNVKMFDANYLLDTFGEEALTTNYIYAVGEHSVSLNGVEAAYIITLDNSSATVKTWGNSSATVKTWDNSSATVKTLDNSSATVETWGNSSATVETLDNSSATVETLDNSSKLTYSLGEGSCPTIKHLNERKLFVKVSDFEIVQQ